MKIILQIDLTEHEFDAEHACVYASNVGHMVYSKLLELQMEGDHNYHYYVLDVEVSG